MRAFSRWILVLFASPIGVVALAFLDSTLFFSLPFGIDAARLDSDRFQDGVLVFIALAVVLTALSIVRVTRSTRPSAYELQPRKP